MSIISNRLDEILQQNKSPIWRGYVNMLKLLKNIFSPKHWVLEFLQNAEDAGSKKISIRIEQGSLCILNDGKVFDEEAFFSICDVNSRKLPSLGFWGYLGIGFKSIFQITKEIHIHSGDFHFMFNEKKWDDADALPWEILPREIDPINLPGNYTTGFYIPLQDTEGQKILDEIEQFLMSDNFPKEAIVFLKNINAIEVYTTQISFTITKKQKDCQKLIFGESENIEVEKILNEQGKEEKSNYLIFRKIVDVPLNIKEDETTIYARRANVPNRAIGLFFELDKEGNIQSLAGKLAGVYSFLPVEGEQTGLPFGIFGDFISHPGRELINYGAKWNHWIADEIKELFKTIVQEVLLSHHLWKFFPARLIDSLDSNPAPLSGPSREFWEQRIKQPIRDLRSEAIYPDENGIPRKLDELIRIEDEIISIVGKDIFLEKKIVHPIIKDICGVELVDIYKLLRMKGILENLKSQPEKLAGCYRLINTLTPYYINGRGGRDISYSCLPFVLADDGELYSPYQVTIVEIDNKGALPKFLAPFLSIDKKLFLHPEIAKDEEAVEQLKRCGINTISQSTISSKCRGRIQNIKDWSDYPDDWETPDTLIEATLSLIISEGSYLGLSRLVAQDGSLQSPEDLFFPDALLHRASLWKPHFFPNLMPIHEKYLMQEELKEKTTQYFKWLGVIDKIEGSSIGGRLRQKIEDTTCKEKCPESWEYPDTVIEATLFLIAQEITPWLPRFVAQDSTLHVPTNLFVPESPLDWTPLWKAGFLPGFQPVHEKYLNQEKILEKVLQYFKSYSFHGFDGEKDKSLIEIAAYEIAKRQLTEEGHQISQVSNRDNLGYDLECQGHCEKVFEVKGMGEPHDIKLQKSEYFSAQQKQKNYTLVCVYNLPDKPGYKEISNPGEICQPIEEAKIPKNEWLKR